MDKLQQLIEQYSKIDCRDLGSRKLEQLRDGLKDVNVDEIRNISDGRAYIDLLKKFREAVAENDKLHGENYPKLLNSLLSVGEDGLYSNNLRFIFELIQNVDDCDYKSAEDCRLDMHFDFNQNVITLTYNEVGFSPFNVFAITGIAEAAKNVSSFKNEIGEKGIGFKSVFGVASKVLIRSGWFSFELHKRNFTIPIPTYTSEAYCNGTQMTLYVTGKVEKIYNEIKKQYCSKDALFSRNPLLFLNKLTSLKMYFDTWRSMEFYVSRSDIDTDKKVQIERDIELAVNLHDYDKGSEVDVKEMIKCSRYSLPVVFTKEACKSRYGVNTQVGGTKGKQMIIRLVFPNLEYISEVGKGALYSFLPTQLKLTVPMVCHVPFKLDASREFVDPQDENIWFKEASKYLAKLIDYAYQDWKKIVKENIVSYIPNVNDNLFARNNGKERCLSMQNVFLGKHFMDMPLFYAIDGMYHISEDLFCFDQDEQIEEPEKVYRLMGNQRILFVPTVPINGHGFFIERNVKNRLFKRALFLPDITAEVLDYLDSVEYVYSEKQISNQEIIELTSGQIVTIFKHNKLADLLQGLSRICINKNMRLKLTIKDGEKLNLVDALYDDFELSETPSKVENYMRYCNEKCICLDIGEDDYLPCYNAIVLSKNNSISSFAAFCYDIDQRDTFAIRVKLREASKRLNQYVEDETGSSFDYLRNLRNVRLLIKDSLGNNGYRSYINLILQSGTDKGRFIQEILQNADDCEYVQDTLPTFNLTQNENVVITEYNEVGFNRANIRSITAIGESTKNNLFKGDLAAIGEKGVGFKTIFAVASEVRIQSGEYAFALTDREPTIPRTIKGIKEEYVSGTRMEVELKDIRAFPVFNDKTILELCLCLRKLKSINIGAHSVLIEDTDEHRIITIDKRQHIFRRFIHDFNVCDEKALKERRNSNKVISANQRIVCFVPEKGGLNDYALYNGLPTKHRIKIPLVIDAPFALTTSREEIETDCSAWNEIVRKEMYSAILTVIDALKSKERAKVLRFTRFLPRLQGNTRVYHNEISDCIYLNSYDFLSILKGRYILPTFDEVAFAKPQNKTAYRFPDAANILFGKVIQSEYAHITPASIIDVDNSDYDATLNALGCETASFSQAFPIIERHAERFISYDEFRPKLYEFLQEASLDYQERLRRLAIIPVYGKTPSSVEYISWKDESIFVKKGATISGVDYYVLNENILSKNVCEKIFGANINEMNFQYEKSRYNARLKEIVEGEDSEKVYNLLISELKNGSLQKNDAFSTLYALTELIPLKNELGEITKERLFICSQPTGYFPTKMIQELIVHKECIGLAKYLCCEELNIIHYDDIYSKETLTADDVETLLDDYFDNSEEILRGFYKDDLFPDELIRNYNLDYLAIGYIGDNNEDYDFPVSPIGNRNSLREHIKKQWQNPVKVVSVVEERKVQKGQNIDGNTFDLSINDAREGALKIYTPYGARDRCFCQMCLRVKPYKLIEVNNIELHPTHYFPQLRIALCLECSRRFIFYRLNSAIRDTFIESIKSMHISPNQGTVDVNIGDEDKITFTAKHLAEVQEILLQKPSKFIK